MWFLFEDLLNYLVCCVTIVSLFYTHFWLVKTDFVPLIAKNIPQSGALLIINKEGYARCRLLVNSNEKIEVDLFAVVQLFWEKKWSIFFSGLAMACVCLR